MSGDLLPYLPGFLAAYAILVVAATSPGPAVAMLLGISLSQGRGAALVATVGIALGSVTINIVTLLGVGLLLQQAAWAMQLLRLVGAGYLLWLAWGAFRKAASPNDLTPVAPGDGNVWRLFLMGYLLQVTNPKAIVFWLAIAAVGATQGGGAGIIALFVIGAFLISFVCHGAWAVLLSSAPFRRSYARLRRPVEAVLGGFFVLFAYRLATERT